VPAVSSITGDFSNTSVWTKFDANVTVDATNAPTRVSINMITQTNITTGIGFDLTNDSLTWKDEEASNTTSGGVALRNNNGAADQIRWLRGGAGWVPSITNGGTAPATMTYAQATLRPYKRIRHSSGSIFWEAASDPTFTNDFLQFTTTVGTQVINNLAIRFEQNASGILFGTWRIQELNGTAPPAADKLFGYRSASGTANITPVAGTVSPLTTVTVPLSLQATDLSILAVEGKQTTTGTTPTMTTPTGWTLLSFNSNGSNLTGGVDTGTNYVGVYYRTGTYTSPSIAYTGMDHIVGYIMAFRLDDTTATWDATLTGTTGGDSSSAANLSMTGAAGLNVAAGDHVLCIAAASGDIGTRSAWTIGGMAGATIDAQNTLMDFGTTSGNDSALMVTEVSVLAGSSSAAPTYAVTNASVSTGHAAFVRLRATAAATTARFQGINVNNQARRVRASNW
jgi:hypothetical protein